MTPSISIVMPFRDAGPWLPAALASVVAQTRPDWELLAVDDRSRDSGPALVAALARVDPRVRLLAAERPGIVAALEAGCAAARCDLVARFDADDTMHPTRLERQCQLLAGRPEVGVASCLVEFGGDAAAQGGFAAHVAWANSLVEPDEIRAARFVDAPVPHPSVMFRRELLDRHGGYREGSFPEDYELWLRWLHAGVAFAKVREPLLRWNDPPGRLSRTDPRYAAERHAELKCAWLARDWHRRGERRGLWLWGAGRVTRRRFDGLAAHGVPIEGFVDIDPRKIGRTIAGCPVVGPSSIPGTAHAFVLLGVAARGARELGCAAMAAQGRRIEADFLPAG